MKKTIAMSLAAVMSAAALAGCSGGSSAPAATAAAETSAEANGAAGVKDTPGNAQVVKFGNSGAIGEPAPQTCQEFCDIVNAKIGDRYYFEFYPAEQLGNETTMLENIQVGLQEGMMCALDTLATYESDLNILSMAFAFDSYDNMIDYLKSDVAAPIWETLDGQGIHVINFEFQKNPRIFFANKELKSPADMVGMKYRIPNLPIFEKNARAMGATPVVVAWSEYPFALMQGVVDGGECSKDSYRSAGHHSERTLDQWNKDKEWLISEGGVTFCDIDRQAFINAAAPLGAELQSEGFFTTPDLYDQTRQFNQ